MLLLFRLPYVVYVSSPFSCQIMSFHNNNRNGNVEASSIPSSTHILFPMSHCFYAITNYCHQIYWSISTFSSLASSLLLYHFHYAGLNGLLSSPTRYRWNTIIIFILFHWYWSMSSLPTMPFIPSPIHHSPRLLLSIHTISLVNTISYRHYCLGYHY